MKNTPSFQADLESVIIQKNGQKMISTSKYYFTPQKIRLENPTEGSILIINIPQKTTYVFNKAANSWIKFPLTEKELEKAENFPKTKIENLPDTVMDGKPCAVTLYTYSDPESKNTGKTTVYSWKGKNIPVKIIGNFSGVTTEVNYKNIVLTTTADSYFVPPAGALVQDMTQYINQQIKGK
jgi:hypothetical protein